MKCQTDIDENDRWMNALFTQQTIVHWISIIISIFAYFVFALIYNGVCIDCFGLNVPFWVMQHAMGTVHFWVVCMLVSVAAVLPR